MSSYFWYAVIVAVLFAIPIAFLTNSHRHRSRGFHAAMEHQYDYTPSGEASFETKLKDAGMKPDTKVTCGQNTFAYDREKGKLLIQTQQVPEGALLHSRDVVVYELLCGVDVVAQGVRDGRHMPLAVREDMADCDRIELQIETKHKDYPQIELVLMPFWFEKAEARASAMDAARRIVEALDEVLREK